MPRDLTHREKLVEDVKSLRAAHDYWTYVLSTAYDTKREELATAVQKAQLALGLHDHARARAPEELTTVDRRLAEAQRALKLEENKDLNKLVDLVAKADAIRKELEADPEAAKLLAALGL